MLRANLKTIFSIIICTSAISLTAALGNPLGEKANYQLDKSGGRTSFIISGGSAVATITKYLPDHPGGPHYTAALSYDMTAIGYGRQQGAEFLDFPAAFFTPEFMEKLRKDKLYVSDQYKMKHEGQADAKTLDGNTYAKCDKIYIYDVKTAEGSPFRNLMLTLAGLDPNDMSSMEANIEDVTVRAHIYFPGVPALAAVKFDMTGKVDGVSVKAGFDYKKPK